MLCKHGVGEGTGIDCRASTGGVTYAAVDICPVSRLTLTSEQLKKSSEVVMVALSSWEWV